MTSCPHAAQLRRVRAIVRGAHLDLVSAPRVLPPVRPRRWTMIFLNALLLFVVLVYVYPLKFLATLVFGQMLDPANTSPIQSDQVSQLIVIYGVGVRRRLRRPVAHVPLRAPEASRASSHAARSLRRAIRDRSERHQHRDRSRQHRPRASWRASGDRRILLSGARPAFARYTAPEAAGTAGSREPLPAVSPSGGRCRGAPRPPRVTSGMPSRRRIASASRSGSPGRSGPGRAGRGTRGPQRPDEVVHVGLELGRVAEGVHAHGPEEVAEALAHLALRAWPAAARRAARTVPSSRRTAPRKGRRRQSGQAVALVPAVRRGRRRGRRARRRRSSLSGPWSGSPHGRAPIPAGSACPRASRSRPCRRRRRRSPCRGRWAAPGRPGNPIAIGFVPSMRSPPHRGRPLLAAVGHGPADQVPLERSHHVLAGDAVVVRVADRDPAAACASPPCPWRRRWPRDRRRGRGRCRRPRWRCWASRARCGAVGRGLMRPAASRS